MTPAGDVLAAEAGLHRRTVREARSLMRRGRVAPDVPRARLVVALARDAQRRQSNPLLSAFFAVLVIAWLGLFVARLKEGHVDLLAIVWGLAAAWGVYTLWVLWRMRTGAPRAELCNLSFLREVGEPYSHELERAPTRVPTPALVTSTLAIFVFYDLTFGALTLAMDGRGLSLARIAGHGAFFAVLMTLFNLTLMRRRNQRQALRSTVGQDG